MVMTEEKRQTADFWLFSLWDNLITNTAYLNSVNHINH